MTLEHQTARHAPQSEHLKNAANVRWSMVPALVRSQRGAGRLVQPADLSGHGVRLPLGRLESTSAC